MIISTPYYIEILMHCHTRPTPHPDSSAASEAIKEFLELGVIKPTDKDGVYTTTDLGSAWVKAICNTKLPRTVYLDESGEQL